MKKTMRVACDTHVHCYQFELLPELLDSVAHNLDKYVPEADAKVIFFTDGFIDRTWLKLQELIQARGSAEEWVLVFNQESGLVEASKQQQVVYIAPARQVNTAGRLEMLLLGCDQDLEDKQAANDLIEQYGDQYVLISPWGVGKWLGKRGRVLVDIINFAKKPFALGDNGGRPFFWPVPHFNLLGELRAGSGQTVIKQDVAIINGSDPLPVSGDYVRAGSYGVSFDLDQSLSLKTLLESLKSSSSGRQNFGKPMGLVQFVICRIKMLLR